MCYEGDKITQLSTNPSRFCQKRWRTPTSQNGLYWRGALDSDVDCFDWVGFINARRVCLYKSELGNTEYGQSFIIKVKDTNNNLVSGCVTSSDCASNTNGRVTCQNNVCV